MFLNLKIYNIDYQYGMTIIDLIDDGGIVFF
jgi:hypothetical protein